MSLNVYSTKYPPKDMDVIKYNDSYFIGEEFIPDTPLVHKVLAEVEHGQYLNEGTLLDRTGMPCRASNLSTGVKTLLNILNHPEICFDTLECGCNMYDFLFQLQSGNMYAKQAFKILTVEDIDVIYANKHYSKAVDFMEDAYNERF